MCFFSKIKYWYLKIFWFLKFRTISHNWYANNHLTGHMSPDQKKGGRLKKIFLKKIRDLISHINRSSVKFFFNFFHFFRGLDSQSVKQHWNILEINVLVAYWKRIPMTYKHVTGIRLILQHCVNLSPVLNVLTVLYYLYTTILNMNFPYFISWTRHQDTNSKMC